MLNYTVLCCKFVYKVNNMAKEETKIVNQIRSGLGSSVHLFRNHVGTVKASNGRWHKFGLGKGSSDLIGYTSVDITPDMVGKTVAVFTAIEVKTPKGKMSEDQKLFHLKTKLDGGCCGTARSVDDAQHIINAYIKSSSC